MHTTAKPGPIISLSEGFGPIVTQGPKIKVHIAADGSVNIQTSGPVTTATPQEPTPELALTIGTQMPDGSIYAGISPDTERPMYATRKDTPLTFTFKEASEHPSKLDAHGRQDWRVPTKDELDVLFQNRASIGGFDTTGSFPAGWYWSSSARAKSFRDGTQNSFCWYIHSALRCVRG